MAGRRLLRVMPPLRQYTRAPFIAFPWETSPHPRDAPPRFPKKLTVPRPQSPPEPTRHPKPIDAPRSGARSRSTLRWDSGRKP